MNSRLLFFFILTSLCTIYHASPIIVSVSTSYLKDNFQRQGSLAGGTLLYLKGNGFDTNRVNNEILIGVLNCPIEEANSIFLTCRTPKSTTDGLAQTVRLIVNNQEAVCLSGITCDFTFMSGLSQTLDYLSPRSTFPGNYIIFAGIFTVTTTDQILYKLGDSFCDRFEIEPEIIYQNQISIINCHVSPIIIGGLYSFTIRSDKGGDPNRLVTFPTYNYEAKRTYDFAFVPLINSVSSNKGSIKGQIIKIYGSGFSRKPAEITVTADDLPCEILTADINQITCKVAEDTRTARSSFIIGQSGLLREMYYWDSYWNPVQLFREAFGKTQTIPSIIRREIIVVAETTPDISMDLYAQRIRGYFRAPFTGLYKFYLSSDDGSELWFSEIPDTSDRCELFLIASVPEYSVFRYYWKYPEQISKPLSLEAGRFYLMEFYNIEVYDLDHFSIAVEVPATDVVPNTGTVYEVSNIFISYQQIPEEIEIRVWGATGGKIQITMGAKSTGLWNWPLTDAEFERALNKQLDYLNAKVTRGNLDANGITILTGVVSGYVYTIRFLRYRANQILPSVVTSGLTGNVQKSIVHLTLPSPPIRGSFAIIYNGITSVDIPYNSDDKFIYNILINTYQFPKDIKVTLGGFPDGDDAKGSIWTIFFINTLGNIPDFTFDSSKLTGGQASTSPTATLNEMTQGSFNQFFDPIPFDMIYTEVPKPQVIVNVNNVRGSCNIESDCSYEIDVTKCITPEVQSFTVTAEGLSIELTNPGSIQLNSEDFSIEFAENSCTQVTLSSLTITCLIDKNLDGTLRLVAGNFMPIIHLLNLGYFNYAESLSGYDVPLNIGSVSPSSGGDTGGTIVEIVGTGFSLNKNSLNQMEVKVSSSIWEILSVENTKAILKTMKKNGNGDLMISLNGKIASSAAFSYASSGVPIINSISPKTSSPVQKAVLTISGLNFGNDKSKIRCILDQGSNFDIYELNVFSVTDTAVVCKLEGGKSGSYSVRILKDPVGSSTVALSEDNLFKYQFTVESVSPNSGSRYGGTLLTITGTNFSPYISQSQISIGSDNILCDVKSATSTVLTCITRSAPDTCLGEQELVVQQRLLETGVCTGYCVFEYLSAIDSPEVTSATISDTGEQVSGDLITIVGTNLLPSTAVTTKIIFQPKTQATINAKTNSNTEITFDFPSLVPGLSSFQVLIDNIGFALVPSTLIYTTKIKFSSVSPTTGSLGGGILTIKGNGFGKKTTVSFSNAALGICNLLTVSPTTITCRAPKDVNHDVKLTDSTTFTCTGCYYHGDTAKTPYVTAISSNTVIPTSNKFSLTFTGTGITLETIIEISLEILEPVNTSYLKYIGLATSSSATSLQAEFTNVPAGARYTISILFNQIGYAFFKIDNTVKVNLPPPTTTSVVSSNIGGKKLTFNGLGFIFDPKFLNGNKITICGGLCPVTSSTYSSLECEIPPLITTISDSTYTLSNSDIIPFEAFNDLSVAEKVLSDGDTASVYTCSTVACFVKFSFGDSKFALIDYFKFYPDILLPIAKFSGIVIEGSHDDLTYITMKQVKEQELLTGWNYIYPDSIVSYKYIRIRQGISTSSVRLGEVQFIGKIFQDSTADLLSVKCEAKISINGESQIIANAVEYRSDATPILKSIIPKYGSTHGDTTVTISGSGFGTDAGAVNVIIDNIPCVVSTVSDSSIICKTGSRPLRVTPSLEVRVNEQKAANNGTSFLYVDRWSDSNTWGGEQPPREGENAFVPQGQVVLVDVSTPILSSVIIEGGIVFEDVQDLEFNAHIIICRRCFIQIGTEEAPYTHKLTMTLYGKKSDEQLPFYGNKGLIIQRGKLDIHGVVRTPTWTLLASTATKKDLTIQLLQEVDWRVGEQIVIATTDWSLKQSETRYITQVSADKKTLTLDRALEFTHISVKDEYGPNKEYFIEMRAEVALLTRNVLFRGDEISQSDFYGAHMIIDGTNLEGTQARISYAEFYNVGQQFIPGRYPIQFHLCGDMQLSYVVGNAVHHSNARLVTVHGSRFLRIQKNVGFEIFGNQYFLEDGAETNNIIEDNVAINTKRVWTVTDNDISASAFWVTHPNNILRRNRAAGGELNGFLYEFKPNPTGPSVNPNSCPEGEILGEFADNESHSFLRHGLRVKLHRPRTFPCKPAINIDSPIPYLNNPSKKVSYKNFTAWKNGENGVQFEDYGHIWLENMKFADNKEGAIDMWVANVTFEGAAKIKSVIIVGKSIANPGVPADYKYSRGIILPRSNFFSVEGIVFINFYQENQMTALAACSMCNTSLRRITGGKTTKFKDLEFITVEGKIFWQGLKRDIFVDLDGTLTGFTPLDAPYYLTSFYPHLLDTAKGCKRDDTPTNVLGGSLICPKAAPIREILFYLPAPGVNFKGVEIYILRVTPAINILNATLCDYSISQQILTLGTDTPYSWGFPFVVGNTYNIHWSNNIDFTFLPLRASPEWQANEKLILSFNYTTPTQSFNVLVKTGTTVYQVSQSTSELQLINPIVYGANYQNFTTQTLYLGISGTINGSLGITPVLCGLTCNTPAPAPVAVEAKIRLWSNASMWPGGKLPAQGENVVILDDWHVLLDIDPPALGELRINGILEFDPSRYLNLLSASAIFIFRGSLVAGNETNPYLKRVVIRLNGVKESPGLQIDEFIEGGNKVIAVTGKMLLYGIKKKNPFTRLSNYAKKGNSYIELDVSVEGDWLPWDTIVIGPSDFAFGEYEILTIASVSGRLIYLTSSLKFDHYGDPNIIETPAGSLDMRAVVGLLSRNIVIQGSNEGGGWGCHILICKTFDKNGLVKVMRNGEVQMRNVEINACGQPDSSRAAIHFESLPGRTNSKILNSAIYSSYGWGLSISNSSNIDFANNVVADSLKFAIQINQSNNFRVSKNMLIGVRKNSAAGTNPVWDSTAGLEMWDFIKSRSQILINDNVAQGINGVGFLFPANVCGEKSGFFNNSGSSSLVGWLVSTNGTDCINISRFSAYKNSVGVIEYLTVASVRASYLVLAENKDAMQIMYGHEADDNRIEYSNLWIAALARPNCINCYPTSQNCSNFRGIRIAVINQQGQPIPVSLVDSPEKFIVLRTETAFEGRSYHINNTYVNFQENYSNHSVTAWQKCQNNKVFSTHPGSSDASTTQILIDTECIGCDEEGLVEFLPPLNWWIGSLGGCGKMTCTGPNNVLISDISGKFFGKIAQAIPENQISQAGVCKEEPSWRGNFCEGNDFTVLTFESVDANRRNRVYTSVNVTSGDSFKNVLNMWREWAWDAGKSNNKRLVRFWGVVLKNRYYNITFSESLPKDMRFLLQDTNHDSDFVIIRLVYDLPVSLQILVNGLIVKPYILSEKVDLLKNNSLCGGNNFNPDFNSIEFVVNRNPDCIVRVRYVDAVKMSLRMDTTVDEFYKNIKVTSFINKLTSFLGIDFSRLKIYNIRKGSVIVDFFIDSMGSQIDTTSPSIADLNKYVDKILEALGSNSFPIDLNVSEFSAINFNSSQLIINISGSENSNTNSNRFIFLKNNTNTILEFQKIDATKQSLITIISVLVAFTSSFLFMIIVVVLYRNRNSTQRVMPKELVRAYSPVKTNNPVTTNNIVTANNPEATNNTILMTNPIITESPLMDEPVDIPMRLPTEKKKNTIYPNRKFLVRSNSNFGKRQSVMTKEDKLQAIKPDDSV